MNVSWLVTCMCGCWGLTLLGGLGVHVLTNFNGKKLEAYCRLRRRTELFGEILDEQEQALVSAQHLLLFGLVVSSIAAGALIYSVNSFEVQAGVVSVASGQTTRFLWVIGWLLSLMLAGLWLPRIVVRYSSSLILYHSWPLWKALAILTRPFSRLGEAFTWLGHRLSDEPEGQDFEDEVIEDEIRTIVTAGQRDGVFPDGVPEMIEGVMTLDESDVEEIMTPRSSVDAVDVEMPWDEVVKLVTECGRTRIPVYRSNKDNIIGILFVKDLLSILPDPSFRPGAGTLESFLRKPWFIPASKSVAELLRVFLHNRNHMAIVVDDYQQFIGVVTIEDALEEIVGEISDEMDVHEDSEILYDEDTHCIEAEGKVAVEDLSELLGLELPESDDYDTIGGLVIHRLSRIPAVGTEVEVSGVRITVLRATRRMVQRVRLELMDADSQPLAI